MPALPAVKAFLREEILPWRREKTAKPLSLQAREMLRLWRRWRSPPSQYLRARLYRRRDHPIEEFMPVGPLRRFREACNAGIDPSAAEDKALFARLMAQAGLPAVPELFFIDAQGGFAAREGPISRVQAEGALRAAGAAFVKPRRGQGGEGAVAWRADQPVEAVLSRREVLVQARLDQHPALAALHPASINSVRVDTLWTGERAETSAAILRMGAGGAPTDNTTLGGLLAPIDVETGVVRGPGLQEPRHDPALRPHPVHPDGGAPIEGLALPFWPDLLEAIQRGAALLRPLRTLGWDVALTPEGPVLIEANHNWFMSSLQWARPLGGTPLGRAAEAHHRTGRLPPV